jgi:hypothetical protein
MVFGTANSNFWGWLFNLYLPYNENKVMSTLTLYLSMGSVIKNRRKDWFCMMVHQRRVRKSGQIHQLPKRGSQREPSVQFWERESVLLGHLHLHVRSISILLLFFLFKFKQNMHALKI